VNGLDTYLNALALRQAFPSEPGQDNSLYRDASKAWWSENQVEISFFSILK